jgi:protein TonB
MVPPEEIDKEQPATLPADFGEWDSGDGSEEKSASSGGEEVFAVSGSAPRPAVKASAARVAVLPVANRSANGSARAQATPYAKVSQVYQPPQSQSVKLGASKYDEIEGDGSHGHKKVVAFGTAGAIVVLLAAGTLGYVKMRPKAVTPNQTAGQQTTMENTERPTAATSSAATAANAPATANTPDTPAAAEPAVPLRSQSEAMNKQLNAPSRISSDLKALTGRQAPPSSAFGAGGVEGMGGAGSVFGGQGGPKVKVETQKKVNLSAGVAVGLLVQKTAPVYPPLAKSARVSGTVVLQATISRNGSVGNLRVVSGPAMLRQSALNAVKSWRFRPYLLDGEPVEVDTTVNVNFALAQ